MSDSSFQLNSYSVGPDKLLVLFRNAGKGKTTRNRQLPPSLEKSFNGYMVCLNAVAFNAARELGIDLEGLDISISGALKFPIDANNWESGYKSLHILLTPETKADVVTLTQWLQVVEKRCPVHQIISATVPVVVSVKKNFHQQPSSFSVN